MRPEQSKPNKHRALQRLALALMCVCTLLTAPRALAAHTAARPSGKTIQNSTSITLNRLISPFYSTIGKAIGTWLPGGGFLFRSELNGSALHHELPLQSVFSRIAFGRFNLGETGFGAVNLRQPIRPVQERYKHGNARYLPFVGLRYLFRFDGPPGARKTDDWGVNFSLEARYR